MHTAECLVHQPPIGALSEIARLFSPLVNISLKRNLHTVEKGYFLLQYGTVSQKIKINGYVCGEQRDGSPRITFGRTATIAIIFY
jgi:hypothetical protein